MKKYLITPNTIKGLSLSFALFAFRIRKIDSKETMMYNVREKVPQNGIQYKVARIPQRPPNAFITQTPQTSKVRSF